MPRELKQWERIVVLDDGTRAVEGPGYLVEVDENDEPVDILSFVAPSVTLRGRARDDGGASSEE